MKKILRVVSLSVSLFMAAGVFGACGNQSDTAQNASNASSGVSQAVKPLEPVTLNMMLFNAETPKGMDDVLNEFYKQTKDSLNVKLNIEWNAMSDHKEKLKLRIAAGESIDIVFDAPFATLVQNVANGAYAKLDSYFNNDKYPNIKKAFTPDVVAANKFQGFNYTIPLQEAYLNPDGIYIRKDLREKYGLKKIENLDQYKIYLDTVLANEKGMVGMSTDGTRGWFRTFEPNHFPADAHMTQLGTAGLNFVLQFDKDEKKLLTVATVGDSKEVTKNFPKPWDDLSYKYKMAKEWQKYLDKDSINQKDKVSYFASGKAAACENNVDPVTFINIQTKLKASIPSATLEYFLIQKDIADMKPKSMGSTFMANNSDCIMEISKNKDRAMMLFDWIFASQKNHDLFQFGIEGKNWTAVGTDKYKMPEGVSNSNFYIFPSYELTANKMYIRYPEGIPDELLTLSKYIAQDSTWYKRPDSGYAFDNTNVKNEAAKVGQIYGDTTKILLNGLLDDVDGEVAKMYAKEKDAGLETIRAEIKKQVEAWLATKK